MYSSLIGWCIQSVKIKPYLRPTASGDSEYGPLTTVSAVRVDETKVTLDKNGKEYVSLCQYYTESNVKVNDIIMVDSIATEVKHVDKYYDTPDMPSLCVVYI